MSTTAVIGDQYVNDTTSVITADGRTLELDQLADLYRSEASKPIPVAGRLSSLAGDGQQQQPTDNSSLNRQQQQQQLSLTIDWKVRDLDRMEPTRHATQHLLKLTADGQHCKRLTPAIGQPVDVTNEAATVLATSGDPSSRRRLRAVIRNGAKDPQSPTKPKQWLEIWDQSTRLKSLDLNEVDEHLSIVSGQEFTSFQWSPTGRRLLYTAQYKPPKAQSFYKKLAAKPKSDDSAAGSKVSTDTRGQEFVYRDDWGELYDGVSHTVVAILDTDADYKIRVIQMDGYSLGQPFWIGNTGDDRIGFVGWVEQPRRLGLTYCPNRLSGIFTVDLTATTTTDGTTIDAKPELICGLNKLCVKDPRIAPDGQSFVYLENDSGGPHHTATRLRRYDFLTESIETIIDDNGKREIVTDTDDDGNRRYSDQLAALFLNALPVKCFFESGKHLVVNCLTELNLVLCLVDIATKQWTPIQFPLPSAELIDLSHDISVVVGSAVNVRPNVFVGRLNVGVKNSVTVQWLELTDESDNRKSLATELTYNNYWLPSADDPSKLITAILVSPIAVATKPAPTILWPHGGPHSVIYNCFAIYPLLFARLGFKTLLVNYRGSLGVDRQYVDDLTGNVGDNDVKDCIKCLEYLSDEKQSLVDINGLVLFGGSHGGFLVTHLSGQYSNDWNFRSCVTRNPVIDISVMKDISDIPDWCYCESFGTDTAAAAAADGDHDFAKQPPTGDQLRVMFDRSPIRWVASVRAPTLLLLGRRDRRVPYTQGMRWYQLLRARGVTTRCHLYDDCHSLGKVDVDSDVFIHTAVWILKHLN
ncbi:acylamino-acid-releasing enzyme-like [Oppia nitens]|uniref:acylamino-acid-releasing enzyme-like n=1 Tax=Oppia nitens TaxID=1686743 RepID=UPI0023DC2683|nr:acylamino-acid-releasing enzyme-like [Oppia nitens]